MHKSFDRGCGKPIGCCPFLSRGSLPSEDLGIGKDAIIEAQISAAQWQEQGLREGETLVLTPRKARVFVES